MIGASFPALLAAAQGGDEQAFAVLWRDLQPAVLRYLRVTAAPVAEDLAAPWGGLRPAPPSAAVSRPS
jgi:RNA polymerase sigma-70 factor, ECF subfamily